jgi:hypothetical protein
MKSQGGYALLVALVICAAIGVYLMYYYRMPDGTTPAQKSVQVMDAAKAARDAQQAHEDRLQKAVNE